jgi:hypothetical protein
MRFSGWPNLRGRLVLAINAWTNYAAMVHLTGGSSKEIEQILDTIRQSILDAANG